MFIASEGDERLAQLVGYADFTAVVVAAAVLVAIIVLSARLRSSLKRHIQMHLLLNVIFILVFVGTAAIYYLVYLTVDPVVVRFAANRRYAEAGFPPISSTAAMELTSLTKQRANETLLVPAQFICVYPGWPVRLLPLVLIPATLISYSFMRRRSAG